MVYAKALTRITPGSCLILAIAPSEGSSAMSITVTTMSFLDLLVRSVMLIPSAEMLAFEEKWRRVHVEEGPITKGSAIDSDTVTRQL